MAKIIPPQGPEFCWAIAKAAYEDELGASNDYLHKHFPEANVLKEGSYRGWKFILVRKEDQFSVAFRGSDSWHNWLGSIGSEVIGSVPRAVDRMDRKIGEWEQLYERKVTLLTSNLTGSLWAASVRKTDRIARVFFNSPKAWDWDRDTHWHLATKGDFLSRFGTVVSEDSRSDIDTYLVLGDGGPNLDDFKPLVQGKNWGQILRGAEPCDPVGMASLARDQKLTKLRQSGANEKVRDELRNAFRRYSETRVHSREMARGVIGGAHNIVCALGYRAKPGQEEAVGAELWNQICNWIDATHKDAPPASDKQGGGVLITTAMDVGLSVGNELWNHMRNSRKAANQDAPPASGQQVGVGVVTAAMEAGLAVACLIPEAAIYATGVQLLQKLYNLMVGAPEGEGLTIELIKEEISKDLDVLGKRLYKAIEIETKNASEEVKKQIKEFKEILDLTAEYIGDQNLKLGQKIDDSGAKLGLQVFLGEAKRTSRYFENKYERLAGKFIDLYLNHNDERFVEKFEVYFENFLQAVRKDFNKIFVGANEIGLNELNALLGSKSERASAPYATEALGSEIELASEIPNWQLLADLSESYIAFITELAKKEQFSRAIQENRQFKQALLGFCEKFSSLYVKLGLLRSQIKPLIEQIHQVQTSFLEANAQRTFSSSGKKSAYLLSHFRGAITKFKWQTFCANLIAEKKFALHSEFGSQFPNRMNQLRDIVRLRFDDRYWEGVVVTFGLMLLCDREYMCKKQFQYIWDPIWQNITTPKDLLVNHVWNHRCPFHIKEEEYQLAFCLKNRQIEWMDARDVQNHESLLKIKIAAQNCRFYDNSPSPFYNIDNFKLIERSGWNRNGDYRTSMQGLINNYKDVLEKIVEGSPINARNALSPLPNGEVVRSSERDGLPLVFPATLLRRLEELLGPTFQYVQALGQDFFIPRYEFSTRTRELTIHYDLITESRIDNPYKFAQFKVAMFDALTIESFRPDLTSNGTEFDSSEFLIQAMYGNAAEPKLGLPGKGSVDLKNDFKMVAPCEQPFEGLFALWRKYPDKIIQYNSSIVDDELDEKEFVSNRIAFQSSEEYMPVVTLVEKQKSYLVEQEVKHKKLFHLLKILTSLYSGLDRDVVLKRLTDDLRIIPSDHLKDLFDISALEKLSQQELQLFTQELFAMPSEHVRKLSALQQQIYDINDWLSGDADRLTTVS